MDGRKQNGPLRGRFGEKRYLAIVRRVERTDFQRVLDFS